MLTAERVMGALVLVKAVDVLLRGPVALPGLVWAAVLAIWVAAGLVLLAGPTTVSRARLCWCAVVLSGIGIAVDFPAELRWQHLVLLIGVALAARVTSDVAERLLLWRVQLSALYGVAALAKLNESFLGGDVLAGAVVAAPAWSALLAPPPTLLLVLAGVALILTETCLAITPWVARLRVPGTVVAAGFHGATLVLVSTDPLVGLRLVVFGGTAVLLHAACAGLLPAGGRQPTAADGLGLLPPFRLEDVVPAGEGDGEGERAAGGLSRGSDGGGGE